MPELRQRALDALEQSPDGVALCHPDNALMSVSGPIIIDWPDVTLGHPLADVARTLILCRHWAVDAGNPVQGSG